MYKTELCNSYINKIECKYKEECYFAHNIDELRPKLVPINYKERVCDNYKINGTCPYGNKCLFKHNKYNRLDIFKRICKNQSKNIQNYYLINLSLL
jgi:CCCH zinc finger protein C3H-4